MQAGRSSPKKTGLSLLYILYIYMCPQLLLAPDFGLYRVSLFINLDCLSVYGYMGWRSVTPPDVELGAADAALSLFVEAQTD